jgi:hypothetical protein
MRAQVRTAQWMLAPRRADRRSAGPLGVLVRARDAEFAQRCLRQLVLLARLGPQAFW